MADGEILYLKYGGTHLTVTGILHSMVIIKSGDAQLIMTFDGERN